MNTTVITKRPATNRLGKILGALLALFYKVTVILAVLAFDALYFFIKGMLTGPIEPEAEVEELDMNRWVKIYASDPDENGCDGVRPYHDRY